MGRESVSGRMGEVANETVFALAGLRSSSQPLETVMVVRGGCYVIYGRKYMPLKQLH